MKEPTTSARVTRRSIKRRLSALNSQSAMAQSVDEDVVARLVSLAVGSSLNNEPNSNRLLRRANVVVRRVAPLAWAAAVVAVVSVGLASLNGLPDPLQIAMSNVLNAVGINVPNPHDDPIRTRQLNLDTPDSTTVTSTSFPTIGSP